MIARVWLVALLPVLLARAEVADGFRREKLTEIDAAITQAIARGECPGGVLWIEHRGAAYHKAFGNRVVEPGLESATEDTIYDAASLTKVVATTPAVMKLVEQGKVELDAPASRYWPEFRGEGKDAITMRQLLTHTSGLRADLSLIVPWSGTAKALELICAESVPDAPGTKFRYSDINFEVLGEIVHRVSGRTLEEFCTAEIFEPLAMRDTMFRPSEKLLARVAPTERGIARGVVHDPTARRMDGVAGHAGLFTTAGDLARYARMLLRGGELDGVRFFKKETVALMTSVQSPLKIDAQRGLGWDIDSPFAGPRGLFPIGSYGHTGWTGGSLWIDPRSETFVIFLSNRNHPSEKGDVRALRQTLGTLAAEAVAPAGVDATTLTGKVMCGYQGWFRAEGDGSGLGWAHYSEGGAFEPGRCTIDLWPDVAELGADEKFATPFRFADRSPAAVFSSFHAQTVRRHFDWMRDYGIDGVFVQRFIAPTRDPRQRRSMNVVLSHCRSAAAFTGRAWALMYDLSGAAEKGPGWVIDDWKQLARDLKLTRDGGYLRHRGKPVVALWGIGFNDRAANLDEWARLIEFLKNDPEFGGCTVMLGVPSFFRTLDRDSIADAKLHEVIAQADIVSPWSVGRYSSPESAAKHSERTWSPDMAWCIERKLDFLPVIFPGFSWHNLQLKRGKDERLGAIPRLGGKFLWSQAVAAKRAGAQMLYVAMFDEMDEGTAIFKCTNEPPAGASPFLAEPKLPSDHYLWLTGQAARMFRGEIPGEATLPIRK